MTAKQPPGRKAIIKAWYAVPYIGGVSLPLGMELLASVHAIGQAPDSITYEGGVRLSSTDGMPPSTTHFFDTFDISGVELSALGWPVFAKDRTLFLALADTAASALLRKTLKVTEEGLEALRRERALFRQTRQRHRNRRRALLKALGELPVSPSVML